MVKVFYQLVGILLFQHLEELTTLKYTRSLNITKFKKILAIILISSSLVVPFVTMSATSSAKQDDTVMLQNYSKDSEKLINYLKGKNIEKLSSQAKSNKEILSWIVKTKYKRTNSIDEDIKTLNKLNISLDLKLFMLQNLMDKFKFFLQQKNMEDTKGPKGRWLRSNKTSYPYKIPKTHYVYADPINYKGQLYYDGNPIINRGSDYLNTKDYVFSADVSRIGWSTDYIAKLNISQNIEKNKLQIRNYNRQIEQALKNPEINALLKKDDGSLEIVLEHIYDNKDYTGNYISKAAFATLKVLISSYEAIPNFINDFRSLKSLSFGSILGKKGILWKSFKGPIVRATNAAYGAFLMFESIRDLVGGKSLEKNGIKLGVGATLAGLALSTAPAGAVGLAVLAVSAVFALLENVGLGNGYSIWENWHDHGLNDWDFQMKNNTYTMAQIARRYSYNYTQPVEWKVTDGWFSYPELYIKTGQSSSDSGWTHLSPSTSFNFGNKIQG